MRMRIAFTAMFVVLTVGSKAEPGGSPALAARPFSLGDVRLLDSPFKSAMERNASYLLSLEPDRLLHNFRFYSGLPPKAPGYGGWERLGVSGHTLGHYLTAASQQYSATGDARLHARIDYIVSELAACQAAYGDGYVGGLPPNEFTTLHDMGKGLVEFQSPGNFKSGAWAPWYTVHKVLNGLKDAWILTGNTQARDVALKLADWADRMTAALPPDKLEAMLGIEHGGMMDVLAELYVLTGDPKYLEGSRRFYHRAVFDPLLAHRDQLPGLHANTQIPKIIGLARTYEATGDKDSREMAQYFWGLVAHHHSYVIGGNSEDEHFFPEGTTSRHLGPDTAETCNTYNILKLTEHVFGWDPRAEYIDFYERGLYNHILASQEPAHGMVTYFMSLQPGFFKTYSTPEDSFWCCVGTGIENHTKYGEVIYSRGADELFVNLFIPSVVTWKEKGVVIEQRTGYPESDTTSLTFVTAPAAPLTLRVRCPGWAAGPVTFAVNGAALEADGTPGSYATLRRTWAKGDRLVITLPMKLRTESMPDDLSKVAFLYGPLVLAADLGGAPRTPTSPYAVDQHDNFKEAPVGVPALVRGNAPVESYLVRSTDVPLGFHSVGLGRPSEVSLIPFWQISYDRYNVYWDVKTEAQWMVGSAAARPSG